MIILVTVAVDSLTHAKVLANFEKLFTDRAIKALNYLKIGKIREANSLLKEVVLLQAYYTTLSSYDTSLSDKNNWFTYKEYDDIIFILEKEFNICNLKTGSFACKEVESIGGAVYQNLEFIYFQDGTRMEYN